jgi:hypothetical protein
MSAASLADPLVPARGAGRRRALGRLLVPALLLAAIAAVIGVRMSSLSSSPTHRPASSLRLVPIPSNPAVEQAWGIRFTAVLIEADRGMLDLRYQVVDPAKSGRIHGGKGGSIDPKAQLENLPTLVLESTGKKLKPSSAMMHFEHFHFQTELLGSTYSLLYGNAAGLLHVGDKITIELADGLQLRHVVVAN